MVLEEAMRLYPPTDPQRFSAQHKAKRPPYAYIPFSEGRCRCIGENLGEIEAVLLLVMITQRYHLTLAPGHSVEPEPLIILHPPRRPAHALL